MITGEVMDSVASLQNDTAKKTYTYPAQLPYLKMAMDVLQEELERNNVPTTNRRSPVITLVAGKTQLGFKTSPKLPSNLIEIQELWERNAGIDPFVPMTRRDFLPLYLNSQPINQFIYWSWNNQTIEVFAATGDNDIKIDYIASVLPKVLDEEGNDEIEVIGSKSFLQYKTASLCSRFIGENPTRADELDKLAFEALDRTLGISAKGQQEMSTRRLPFRSTYKSRRIW